MNRSVYIRFLSAFLLLVFALSITPKKFLHYAFAKHIDSRCKEATGKSYQFNSSGYNCDNDNLVVESAFITDLPLFTYPPAGKFYSYIPRDNSFSSLTGIYSHLRGPPVTV